MVGAIAERVGSFEVPAVTPPKGFPAINTIKNILHGTQALGTFIVLCIIASVIATEYRFYDGSQPGPNWTLFVGIFSLGVPVCLIVFPWIYDKKGKFRRLGKFCMKPRTNLIFTGFYTGLWATAGIAMTVHANNPDHCNLDAERAEGDTDYAAAWPTQCTNAKVANGFAWTLSILWLLSLLCTLVIFFREKQIIQKNLRQHESNKQAVLQMQQQQEMDDDDMFDEHVGAGRHGDGYRPAGYYEDEGEDLGGMRPQSFEQARPLQEATPPPQHMQQHHQQHRPEPEQSPFDSPYDPPANDPHRMSYGYAQQPQQQQQQYDPHPGGVAVVPEQSPFDDFYRHPSPDPAAAYGGPSPSPPQHHQAPGGPMVMPDHTQYHNPAPYNTGSPEPNPRF
ncbi:hypothetical protein BDA99DRAFT_539123 [Phascolomyces articulosus]|uniref:MARVEL domain-containing protein n=1 Tax=Phascolomyces articulosus TaxID=60185 RepID=A0AAD5JWZ0_9FUNG|nr:hypothetical protein BDA99DRAFT_539123 [Phascolomyces articulosus]